MDAPCPFNLPVHYPQIIAGFCQLVKLNDPSRVTLFFDGRAVPLFDLAHNVETTPRLLGLVDVEPMRRVFVARLRPVPKDRQTPLHLAAEKGHLDMVALLLDGGADPCRLDSGGRRPLDVVCRSSDPPLCGYRSTGLSATPLALPRHLLLKDKPLSSLQAPTEAIRQRLRWASGDVIAAASAGSLEGVRLALARGGSPSERDQAGFTPLHHAALVGEVSVVHELLASGSDANARTKARGMESAPCHLRCCSLAATSACGAPVIPEDG